MDIDSDSSRIEGWKNYRGAEGRKKGDDDDDSNERFIWTVDVAGNGKWSSRPAKSSEMQMNGYDALLLEDFAWLPCARLAARSMCD